MPNYRRKFIHLAEKILRQQKYYAGVAARLTRELESETDEDVGLEKSVEAETLSSTALTLDFIYGKAVEDLPPEDVAEIEERCAAKIEASRRAA